MLNSPNVSVIIINYNSSHYTNQCVASIVEKTASNDYEIIIIDNNSKEEDFQNLDSLKSLPFVKIFQSRINLGFSGGNMLGVHYSNPAASCYFFLNNDCVFVNDVISILSGFLNDNPKVGIVTPQMFSPDMNRQPSFGCYPSVGDVLLGHGFMRLFNEEMFRSGKTEYFSPISIPYATGSALFVRAEYFSQIGGFDTNYFLYCEEEDICMTMRRKGWGIYLVPEARFIHYGGGSTRYNLSIEKEFYISFLYFIRKHYGFINQFALKMLYAIKLFRKSYKGVKFAKLSLFVLKGAPVKESLRFKQVIHRQ